MNPRFPTIEAIQDTLGDSSNTSNYHARAASAFRGIYAIAINEFEILRGLATGALSGHPDAMEDLRKYLTVQAGIADLYARETTIREQKLPRIRH